MVIALFTRNPLRKARPPESPHLLRIKPAKIDCLPDVCISFRPSFGYFKNFKCGELKATALQDFRRASEQPRTLFKRRPAPFAKRCARSFDGALRFGNSCFASVTDNLIRTTGIHRGRQLIGPNLFATNDKWILFAEA